MVKLEEWAREEKKKQKRSVRQEQIRTHEHTVPNTAPACLKVRHTDTMAWHAMPPSASHCIHCSKPLLAACVVLTACVGGWHIAYPFCRTWFLLAFALLGFRFFLMVLFASVIACFCSVCVLCLFSVNVNTCMPKTRRRLTIVVAFLPPQLSLCV